MINFKVFISEIIKKNINNNFKNEISEFVKKWFIKLNKDDLVVLIELTFFLINRINKLFNIKYEDCLLQYRKKNYQDLKAIILLLLPYIIEENTNIYNNLTDLNEIICSKNIDSIKNNILDTKRNEIIKSYFKYSNFGVGLMNGTRGTTDILLSLYNDDEKLIYTIIHHNFISLLNTLSIINGKLYINWLNITPIVNFEESEIYKNTSNTIKKTIIDIINNKNILDYTGLYIGEFYNVYRNIFYEDIKKIKWLIFPYIINNEKMYIIQYLDKKFNFDLLLNNNSFFDLDEAQQNQIKNKLQNLNMEAIEYTIWKNIIIFMCNNYSNKLVIDNKIKNKFILNTIDEVQDNDYKKSAFKKYNLIDDDDVNNFLKNIKVDLLWHFFKESIVKFESTIYGIYLIQEKNAPNKELKKEFNPKKEFEVKKEFNPKKEFELKKEIILFGKLNFKNMYNISKTLSHTTEWKLLPEKYESLDIQQRINFWNKFNAPLNNWLNIRNNLNLENNKILLPATYNDIITDLDKDWQLYKFDFVWDYLTKNGILSEFKVDLELTSCYSNEFTTKKQKELKKKIEKNKIWEDANYYLTNKPFSDLWFLENEKPPKTYFDLITEEQKWYTFYAMDWITQINFFNHYINNRIMFVTGATGQGKSTQVPKLLLYGLKMIDYKSIGKIVCTQPRIGPTTENASRIANELGLQINKDDKKGKIETSNYQVQFKYSEGNHINNSCNHLTLKICTDGSLLEDIINNPLIKDQIFTKDKKSYIYSFENKYDILIIDESHEHNTNMDILTTLLRNSIYYNNSIKFVIMSATLEEDEAIYRRYFSYINDNLIYPIKAIVNHPLIDELFLCDSVYLDRRFHISPPGQTTQYTINEIYLKKSITVDTTKIVNPKEIALVEKKNSLITQLASYDTILNICNTTSKGDILLFANGLNEINKAVEHLNARLPQGIIALPYYGQLNMKYKELIQGIDKKIGLIKNKREFIHKTWGPEYIEDDIVQGKYNRAIIIATNVAEASITINSLKFVIDNGYAKVNNYNEDLDITSLDVEKIAEASRKQRKGRCGRVSEGFVYYIYEEKSREKVKSKFKITQEDFGPTLLKLLQKKRMPWKEEEYILSGSVLDPNIFFEFNKYMTNLKPDFKFKQSFFYKSNIYNIIKKQYFILDLPSDEKYWNPLYFDFMAKTRLNQFMIFETGFALENIIDIKGVFHLVHPFENKIERNILNNIIEITDINGINKKLEEIPSSFYATLIQKLADKLLLLNINNNKIYKNERIDYRNYYVSEIFHELNNLKSKLELSNINEASLLMYARAYDSFSEILEINTLIKTCDYSITNLITNLKNYNSQDTEIEFLYNIVTNFKNKFNYLNIFKIKSLKYLINKYYSNYYELATEFNKLYKKNKYYISSKFNIELWNTFIKLKASGKLFETNGLETILNIECQFTDEIYKDYLKYESDIINWCDLNNINSNIIITFLNNYSKQLINILTINKDEDKYYDIEVPLDLNFTKYLTSDTKIERIIRPFIHAYPYNYAFKLDSNNYYYTFNFNKVINLDTKLNNELCLLYLNINNFKSPIAFDKNKLTYSPNIYDIKITNRININWLFITLPHFFNSSRFKTLYLEYDKDHKSILYKHNEPLWERICNKIANSSNCMIPFEDVNLPIISAYIKAFKRNLL